MRTFKKLFPYLSAMLFFAGVAVASTHPAMATSLGNTGNDLFNSLGGPINSLGNVITGPIAKLAAVIAIIGGVFTFIKSGEVNQAMHIFGGVAAAVGGLVLVANILNMVGTGISI